MPRRHAADFASDGGAKFARLAKQGTLKFVITLEGEMLFGQMHIKHPVLSRTKPVLSAGEAELVFLARGKGFYVAELNHLSGPQPHHVGRFWVGGSTGRGRPLKSSLLHSTGAMRRAGFTVPVGAEKERGQ